MSKKKVLVCGASGFIGFNVFERLSAREDLVVFGTYLTNRYGRIDPKHPRFVQVDFTDQHSSDFMIFDDYWDAIIQMAANTSGAKDVENNSAVHITDNIAINNWIFRKAHDHRVPQIIFPSCTVMYPNSKVPLKETDIDLNAEFYPKYFGGAWMKVYCEKQAEFFSRLGKTRYTIIRHSNIYGPHDRFDPDRSHFCGANIHRVMQAPPDSTIVVWGKGTEQRDFLYISDLVDLIELALDKQYRTFDIFNAGSGFTYSTANWVKLITQIANKKLKVEFDPSKPTIDTCITIDSGKALRQMGWCANTLPPYGLSKTIDWYSKNILHQT